MINNTLLSSSTKLTINNIYVHIWFLHVLFVVGHKRSKLCSKVHMNHNIIAAALPCVFIPGQKIIKSMRKGEYMKKSLSGIVG